VVADPWMSMTFVALEIVFWIGSESGSLLLGEEKGKKSFLPQSLLKLGPLFVHLLDIFLAKLARIVNDALQKISTSLHFSRFQFN